MIKETVWPWLLGKVPRGFWDDLIRQRQFMDWFMGQKRMRSLNDWYRISQTEIREYGGGGLINKYSNNSKFSRVELKEKVSADDNVRAKAFIKVYGDALQKALVTLYPQHSWKPWLFPRFFHSGFWYEEWYGNHLPLPPHRRTSETQKKDRFLRIIPSYCTMNLEKVKAYAELLQEELGLYKSSHWYGLKSWELNLYGGETFVEDHQGSLARALSTLLRSLESSHESLMPWQVSQRLPIGFWEDVENRNAFFDWLSKDLQVEHEMDWYRVLRGDCLTERGGAGLLARYGGTFEGLLKGIRPLERWYTWHFGFRKESACRAFLVWLAEEQLKLQDWRQLSRSQIIAWGGGSLLRKFRGSRTIAFQRLFPDQCFIRSFRWNSMEFRQRFLRHLENLLFLRPVRSLAETTSALTTTTRSGLKTERRSPTTDLSLWYSVTARQIRRWQGIGLVRYLGGDMYRFLSACYPHYHWDRERLLSARKDNKSLSKAQHYLYHHVGHLFPHATIHTNYRHPRLHFAGSQRTMELDLYLPELALCFEYHGEQHYQWRFHNGSLIPLLKKEDEEKRKASVLCGLTMITIPFWWDGCQDSLIATIRISRNDLLSEFDAVISTRKAIPLSLDPLSGHLSELGILE